MLKEIVKEDFMMEKEGKKEYDWRTTEKNETNWKEKSLHGKFPKSIVDFFGQCFGKVMIRIYKKDHRSNYYGCSRSSTEK